MTVTIGRASLNDLYDLSVRGRRVSFTVDIEGSDIYGMQALRQQLAGLVDNRDEEVVPFTWSEDSSLDGFYRVVSVDVPSADTMLVNGYIPEVTVELEQISGQGNPAFEVTTQSVVRTNGHGIATPSTCVGSYLSAVNAEVETPASWGGVGGMTRTTSTGESLIVMRKTAPTSLTAYQHYVPPASYYEGACAVEVKYGSTWHKVVGRQIPRHTMWRITNDIVRLTAADGATAGTFEIWDDAAGAWESRSVAHWESASVSHGIGGATGSSEPSVTITRNAPEQCAVRCVVGSGRVMTYAVQRGAHLVSASFTATVATVAYGVGLASPYAAGTSFTGGVRVTSNDANGNRMVFGTAAANTKDLINTACWLTAAANSGSMFIGVELGGSGAAAGDNDASALRDQFLGAVSWRQRVVVR